jgi:hypothetical protein
VLQTDPNLNFGSSQFSSLNPYLASCQLSEEDHIQNWFLGQNETSFEPLPLSCAIEAVLPIEDESLPSTASTTSDDARDLTVQLELASATVTASNRPSLESSRVNSEQCYESVVANPGFSFTCGYCQGRFDKRHKLRYVYMFVMMLSRC